MFTRNELEVMRKIRNDCSNELRTWTFINFGLPLAIVVITLIVVFFSRNYLGDEFYRALFNGSLPLVAINFIITGAFFLIKFNKRREEELKLDFGSLRAKLLGLVILVFLGSWMIYGSQAMFSPFGYSSHRFLQILGSLFVLIFSYIISRILFLLQEEVVDKSYASLNCQNETGLSRSVVKHRLLTKKK